MGNHAVVVLYSCCELEAVASYKYRKQKILPNYKYACFYRRLELYSIISLPQQLTQSRTVLPVHSTAVPLTTDLRKHLAPDVLLP